MNEIKLCPLCGAKPIESEIRYFENCYPMHVVLCSNSSCNNFTYKGGADFSKEEAIVTWNKK